MSITMSGVGSGLPVQTWIDAMVSAERTSVDSLYTKKTTLSNQKTTLSSIVSDFSSLQTSVQKLTDAKLASSFDLFASRLATSSDSNIATVSASNNAPTQKVTLSVDSLATSTKATSINLSKSIDGSELFTAVANKQGTLSSKHEDGTPYGTFTMYVDGQKNELTIEKTDTLNDIVKKINDKFDLNSDGDYSDNNIKATISNGKLQLTYNKAAVGKLTLGSSSDTTNFLNIMQLSTAASTDNGDGTATFSSLSPINKIDLGGAIVGNAANLNVDNADPITAGTFKVGQSEFTINATTTISDIVSKINKDDKAGVTAQFDVKANKLVLTSKNAGKTAINIENGTSNFLTKVGLITAGGDSLASQTLGDNAKIHINGSTTALEVNSNTVTSDISGIVGLTINLKNKTTSTASDGTTVDKPINISIDQDSGKVTDALDDFVSSYNKLITDVAYKTSKDQPLHGEYTLVNLKNSIRSMAADQVKGLSEYDSLGMIGISTGAVGKNAKDTSNSLTLDKNKLLEALQKNPTEVKALLIGDKKAGITGIFEKLEDKLKSVLDPTKGYFDTKKDSIDSLIASNDKSISKGEDHITAYKKQLTQQFAQMDQYISRMQQQSSSLSSIR